MSYAPNPAMLTAMAAHFEAAEPERWAVAYPRNITPPGGHYSPKTMPACLLGCLVTGETVGYDGASGARQALCMLNLLAANASPVFFLGSDLAQAFVLTEAPGGLRLSEVTWPFNAFTLVLPRGLLKSPKDGYIHAISVGLHLGPSRDNLPRAFSSAVPLMRDGVLLCAVSDNGMLFHLTRDYAPDKDLKAFAGEFPDGESFTLEDFGILSHSPLSSDEIDADAKFTNYLLSFVFQVLLYMSQRPEGVSLGRITRPASQKKGKTRAALWDPNLIGFDYRLRHEIGPSRAQIGSGSVRPHWRRGHHRMQPCGEGRQDRKPLWIEPVFVGAPKQA